jgi:hypothetical protein
MVSAPDEAAGTLGTCAFCGGPVRAPGAIWAGAPGVPFRNSTAATGVLNVGDVLSEAWKLTVANWQPLVLAALIMCITLYGPMFAAMPFLIFNTAQMHGGPPPHSFIAVFFVIYLAMFAAIPMQYGIMVMGSDLLATGTTSVGRIFSAYRRWGRLMGGVLLGSLVIVPPYAAFLAALFHMLTHPGASSAAIVILVSAVALPIMAYAGISLCLIPMEVLDKGSYPVDALRSSWNAVRGQRLMLFAAMLLLGLIGGAGTYLCYVGMLFTLPFSLLGQVIIYRNLRGLTREGEDLYAR